MTAGGSVGAVVGTVADVVSGLGTLGALVVAVAVYRTQVFDARAAQASRIFVRKVYGDEPTPDGSYLEVHNNSDYPI